MDVQLEKSLGRTVSAPAYARQGSVGRSVLTYWSICLLAGGPVLWDWLSAWNVGATLSSPLLVVYLLVTLAIGQILYILVARHDGRPVRWGQTVIFALGNGVAETLAFALVYRIGEVAGGGIVGMFFPAGAGVAGFLCGLALFVVYGGLIHGLYWIKLLPPHFDESPRSRAIRKVRPLFEVALVLGWSLCFWLFRDIWTVVFLHILVDLGLMLRVRPVIFGRERFEH